MAVIYILWLRELRLFVRAPVRILASLGQPLLYLTIIGAGIQPVFQAAGEVRYIEILAPGVISMTILFTAVWASGGLLVLDRSFGPFNAMLVAPVLRVQMVVGRIVGAATVAIFQSTLVLGLCFVVGFRAGKGWAVVYALGVMALVALVFSALGLVIGQMIQSLEGFQMTINMLIAPIFFFSGALFPLDHLPRGLGAAVRLDPLAYGVDALRGVLIGRSSFGVPLDLSVLACIVASGILAGLPLHNRMEG